MHYQFGLRMHLNMYTKEHLQAQYYTKVAQLSSKKTLHVTQKIYDAEANHLLLLNTLMNFILEITNLEHVLLSMKWQ